MAVIAPLCTSDVHNIDKTLYDNHMTANKNNHEKILLRNSLLQDRKNGKTAISTTCTREKTTPPAYPEIRLTIRIISRLSYTLVFVAVPVIFQFYS